MTIKETTEGSVTVLALSGNFMGEQEASLFHEKKFKLLERRRTSIVLDLSGLEMINSFGLGNFVSAMMAARNAGGDLRLAALRGEVKRIVATMELARVFKVYETIEEAVRSFKATE